MPPPSSPRRPEPALPRPRGRFLRAVWRALIFLIVAVAIAVGAMARPDLPLDQLVQTYARPPSQFATIDSLRVHYRDEGKGRPLLLLHGSASSLQTWDGWVRTLSDHRRVVRLDLPGFGLTGPAADRDYSAARMARVAVGLLDQLHIPSADVAGNSLGGRVALELALAHPDRVRALVLIDSAGLSGRTVPTIFRIARVPLANKLLLYVTPRFLVRKNVEEVYFDPARITEATVDRYQDMARRAGNRQALIDRLNSPEDPVLDDRVRELRRPVLIEWGEHDRWIPLEHGRRFRAAIPGAQLLVYPDAGHVPMEELPERTARDADAFLGAE